MYLFSKTFPKHVYSKNVINERILIVANILSVEIGIAYFSGFF